MVEYTDLDVLKPYAERLKSVAVSISPSYNELLRPERSPYTSGSK